MARTFKSKVGPLPIWLWAVMVGFAVWYYNGRMTGAIKANPKGLLTEAFDEPKERADFFRGIATGVAGGVASFYLLNKTKALR